MKRTEPWVNINGDWLILDLLAMFNGDLSLPCRQRGFSFMLASFWADVYIIIIFCSWLHKLSIQWVFWMDWIRKYYCVWWNIHGYSNFLIACYWMTPCTHAILIMRWSTFQLVPTRAWTKGLDLLLFFWWIIKNNLMTIEEFKESHCYFT